MKKTGVCFTASSGGHLEQLLCLKPLMDEYDSFIVTEKTSYKSKDVGIRTYYLKQVNRKEKLFPVYMLINLVMSAKIFAKENPDVIISTGVLATVPLCLIGKMFGKKLIYIESYAKMKDATVTGKLIYRFADEFYVQWESMLNVFPKAKCVGGIY